jgi:hypothetical protein
MYQNTTIIIRKDRLNNNTPIEINKGVWQGCPLSLIVFSIYIDSNLRLAAGDQTKYFIKGLKYSLICRWPGDCGKYRRWTAKSSIYTEQYI